MGSFLQRRRRLPHGTGTAPSAIFKLAEAIDINKCHRNQRRRPRLASSSDLALRVDFGPPIAAAPAVFDFDSDPNFGSLVLREPAAGVLGCYTNSRTRLSLTRQAVQIEATSTQARGGVLR